MQFTRMCGWTLLINGPSYTLKGVAIHANVRMDTIRQQSRVPPCRVAIHANVRMDTNLEAAAEGEPAVAIHANVRMDTLLVLVVIQRL